MSKWRRYCHWNRRKRHNIAMNSVTRVRGQAGFTLIEMLFVLSVFLVMAATAAVLLRPQYVLLEKERFSAQLKADLLYAQQYAISLQQPVKVYIRPKENRYFIVQESNSRRIVERDIPQSIQIGQGTLKPIFEFGSDGRISQFGTIRFSAGKQNYCLYIQIGVGRIYVVKE